MYPSPLKAKWVKSMPSNQAFRPGDRVWVRHVDATQHVSYWNNGEIIDFVNSTPQGFIYRVTFGGYGVNFLINETNLRPYTESSYGEEAFRQDAESDARRQARDVAQRQQERAQSEK